jgi:hypothetical protein
MGVTVVIHSVAAGFPAMIWTGSGENCRGLVGEKMSQEVVQSAPETILVFS